MPRTRPRERARLGRGSQPAGCLGIASDCWYGAGGLASGLLAAGTAIAAGFLPIRALARCDIPRPGNPGGFGSSAACTRSLARCHNSFAPQRSIHDEYAPAPQCLSAVERASGRGPWPVEHLSAAAEPAPDDPLVHYKMGLAVSQAEGPVAAVAHRELTLTLDPSHKESIYNLAQALKEVDATGSREYRDRFAALQAERQDTDRAGTLWNFALAAAKREEWHQAFGLFRQALEVCGGCPARGQIHKNFGIICGQPGDYASAKRELEIERDSPPDNDGVKRALQVVQRSASDAN